VAQDSSKPDFWDTRFRGGVTPWDAGRVPPALEAWLGARRERLRVLVPGCGSGYEVHAFHARGHEVLAIDFSDAALEAAARVLGELAPLARKDDFFGLAAAPFDLLYERAFLCALPRRVWRDWARRMAELVRPGGLLAGLFYLCDNERGPPFGTSTAELRALLEPAFALEDDRPVPTEESLPVFAGRERWMAWRRSSR
jgi:SAM-dependent methyltransferase